MSLRFQQALLRYLSGFFILLWERFRIRAFYLLSYSDLVYKVIFTGFFLYIRKSIIFLSAMELIQFGCFHRGFILKTDYILYAISVSDFLSGLICSVRLESQALL